MTIRTSTHAIGNTIIVLGSVGSLAAFSFAMLSPHNGSCSYWRAGAALFFGALIVTVTGIAVTWRSVLTDERPRGAASGMVLLLGFLMLGVNLLGLWFFADTLFAFASTCF